MEYQHHNDIGFVTRFEKESSLMLTLSRRARFHSNNPAQLWVTSLLPEELFATIDKMLYIITGNWLPEINDSSRNIPDVIYSY